MVTAPRRCRLSFLLLLACLCAVSAWCLPHSARGQVVEPTELASAEPIVATITPDVAGTLAAVSAQALSQQTETARVAKDLEVSNRELAVQARTREIADWRAPLLALAAALGALIGALGAWAWMRQTLQRQTEALVGREIARRWARIDPTDTAVYLPREMGRHQGRVSDFLTQMGFTRQRYYDQARLLAEGPEILSDRAASNCVLLYAAGSVQKPTEWPDEGAFVKLVDGRSPEKDGIGYLLLTDGQVRIGPGVVAAYPLITFSNMPTTVGTNLMTLARALSGRRAP